MPWMCKDPSCVPRKFAVYNFLGLKPMYCQVHKTDEEMIDVRNPKCMCGKYRPTFNLLGLKAAYCSECKTAEMVNVVDPKCVCEKGSRIYNLPGKPRMYCGECKTDEMIDVKNPKCVCGKRIPSFNLPGLKAAYCSECKTAEMDDVANPKCVCGKGRKIYNLPGEPRMYCRECKTDEMIDVVHQKCVCGKRHPSFNLLGLKAAYCSECKTAEMLDVASKKCMCGKRKPHYNHLGLKAAYCSECKTDEMINVKCKRCPGYDGVPCPTNYIIDVHDYCLSCDPDESRRLSRKRDEHAFFEFLKKDGIEVTQREYRIDYRCINTSRSHSFIDGVIIAKNVVVCLELDEDAHEAYDPGCEESRMHDASSELRLEFPGHSIAWIRVNPHTKKNGVRDVLKRALKIRDRRHREAAVSIRDILKIPRDCIEYIGYPKDEMELSS